MRLKQRLSILSVVIFTVLILLVFTVVYLSFYKVMESKEYKSLDHKSLLAAIYYLEKDELPTGEHENIKSQLSRTISRKHIAVFNATDQQTYGDMKNTSDIHHDFLNQVRLNKQQFFTTAKFFYFGILYIDNQGSFVVIAREPKDEFNAQMNSLLQILVLSALVGIIMIFVLSWYLGKLAYLPLENIVGQIKERDSRNFHQPIQLDKPYQELEGLIHHYNLLVYRISQTIAVQKNFIDYVSHELRTPIAALLGTLEVTNRKQRDPEEYEAVLAQLRQYTQDLENTLENMLLLSGAKTSFHFESIRVDEVLWKIIENVISYHQANIEVNIQVDDASALQYQGNEKLLELAIGNVVENAIKYSYNKPVLIILQVIDGDLQIHIKDQGIGIPAEELSQIRENFFRASNAKGFKGKGIGISMAQIIFSMHKIEMHIQNIPGGTQVTLVLPNSNRILI